MALSKNAMAGSYPLPAYNYRVTIGSDTMSFSEVSGLNVEYDKVVYKDGFSYKSGPTVVRSQRKEVSVTMKRGVVSKRNELFTWFSGADRRDISIDLCDPTGTALVRWKVVDALPLKMDAPSFNASGNDIAIETIELIAHNLTIEHL
jgi:phage tail-like protein